MGFVVHLGRTQEHVQPRDRRVPIDALDQRDEVLLAVPG